MVADRTLAAVADDQTRKDPRMTVAMRKKSSQLQMEMGMVAEAAAEIVDDEVAATTTAGVEMVKTNVVEEITKGVVATAAEVVATAAEEVATTDAVVVTTDVVVATAAMTAAAEAVAVMVDVVAEAVAAVDKEPLTMLGHTIHLATIRA